MILNNGDGFSYVARGGKVEGFRADVCSGSSIRCKVPPGLSAGTLLYRNINTSFEKEIERKSCVREIGVRVDLTFKEADGLWNLEVKAVSEDGRTVIQSFDAGEQAAENQDRMSSMIVSQIGKSTGHYRFSVGSVDAPSGLPFMSASALNGVRRALAEQLDSLPCQAHPLLQRTLPESPQTRFMSDEVTYRQNVANSLSEATYRAAGATAVDKAYELSHLPGAELMLTKYCIRYELGICPVHHRNAPGSLQGIKPDAPLFLLNNGKRLALHFDCRRCEMTVTSPEWSTASCPP